MLIVEDEDGYPTYADTEGAAELLTQAGIINARDRIYDWKRRGFLKPWKIVGRTTIYRMADVDSAELKTRNTPQGAPRSLTVSGISQIIGTGIPMPPGPAITPGFVTSRAGDP
jgi:hypothetical protein